MSQTAKVIESKHVPVPNLSSSMPDAFFCFTWQNISITEWIGKATAEAVKELGTTTQNMIHKYPAGHSGITFVPENVPGPTPLKH